MTTKPPMVISDKSITVILDGYPETIDRDHQNWDQVVEAIRNEEWFKLTPLMNIPKGMVQYTQGNVQIIDGTFYFRGIEVADTLVEHIVKMFEDKLPIDNMVMFFENVMQNPDPKARVGMFKWLQAGNMPITEDGYLIGYKYVDQNYKSVHRGRYDSNGKFYPNEHYDHTPNTGVPVTMPRDKCDSDPSNTCSSGLHFCSFGYLGSYSRSVRIVMVKIHPKDIVAVPNEYGSQKTRCCEYLVVGEIDVNKAGDVLAGKRIVRAGTGMTLDNLHVDIPVQEEPAPAPAPAPVEPKEGTAYSTNDPAPSMMFEHALLDEPINGIEVLNMLATHGSQTAVERNVGIPRSTFGDWVKRIKEARATASEANQLSFPHDATGKTYTAQEVLNLLPTYGTKANITKELGIPRSTLNGWLDKIAQSS